MPFSNSAPSLFEAKRSQIMLRTALETRRPTTSITAQLMEIARVQTRDGVAGDLRKGELAGKSYVEALRGSGQNARRQTTFGL